MKTVVFAVAVACMLATTGAVMAAPVLVSEPVVSDSWSVNVRESGTLLGHFDEILIEQISGSLFENTHPTWTGFSVGGWSQNALFNTPTISVATGPATSDTTFWWTFQDTPPPTRSESLYFQAFYQGAPAEHAYQVDMRSDGYFHITDLGVGLEAPSPVVPEPISMIFFGTGLVAVGGYVTRRRMQRT